ncbi:MAG: glycosyltransferase [Alphaproteobacteria bacterium]
MIGLLNILALLTLMAWLYLILGHGGFWRATERLGDFGPDPAQWPGIVAVVPARNEEAVIGDAAASLLAQDYPGALTVIIVDDNSDDGTRAAAVNATSEHGSHVIDAGPLVAGWTGKLWALARGVEDAKTRCSDAKYFWFSDADIAHEPGNLRRLVRKAESDDLDLVSLMVGLGCKSFWERLLIPAFVFYFQKLYPFPWVNDPARRTAAAAGGCVLLRAEALERIGGLGAIRGELIDDCALARAVKDGGAIWLGHGETARSLRDYQSLGAIWSMVARTAFHQLGYSTPMLAGCVLAMALVYGAPLVVFALAAFEGAWLALIMAGLAWGLMTLAYGPTLKLYGRPWGAALALPVAAAFYVLMTVASANQYWRGRGGAWKSRHHGAGGAVAKEP